MSLILDGTNGLSDVDGTAAAPAIRGTDTNTGIFFPAADTIAFSEGGVESMRIDSAGFVGIGTTTPAAKLVSAGSSATNFKALILRNSDGTTSSSASIDFEASTGTQGDEGSMAGRIAGIRTGSGTSGALAFSTTNAGVLGERARIDSSGYLLLGTTAQFGSGKQCNQFAGATENGIALKTTYATTGSNFLLFLNSAGSTAGFITQNGTTTVAYTTSSDYRMKENIAPMTGALTAVSQLKPCTYTWKEDGKAGQGFIAHELQAVVPDCVSGAKDAVDADGNPQYQGIDTSFLVATLTAAIQEQQALITALTTRITALEAA